MADINRGYSFATNETLTATKFHNLIDDAYVLDVGQADLHADYDMINLTQPGSPSTGDNGIDSEGYLSFYNGTAWIRAFAMTMVNNSGAQIDKGDVVVIDPTQGGGIMLTDVAATVGDPRVIGVAGADIANTASGQVIFRGLAQVLCASRTVDYYPEDVVACSGSAAPEEADLITRFHFDDGGILVVDRRGAFGILVEAHPAGAAALRWCLLFR